MEFKRVFFFVTIILALSLTAQVPRTMNYQGKLTDGSGVAVHAPGGIAVTFRIFDVSSGGTALWSEAHASIPVTNGLFDVILGETIPMTIDFDEQYWIELTVGGETLLPREKLSAVGYAHHAVYADTAEYVASGGTNWTLSGTDIYNNNTGNVGIKNTSPAYPLEVDGNVRFNVLDSRYAHFGVDGTYLQLTLWDPHTANPKITFGTGAGTATIETQSNLGLNLDVRGTTTGSLGFKVRTDNGAGTLTDRLSIFKGAATVNAVFANVNVGIGTASPGYKLEVDGDAHISDAFYLSTVPVDATYDSVLTIDGGQVKKVATSSLIGPGSGWLLTGNAGTVDGTNFIGTTDNVAFNFRVNNQKAGRIGNSDGSVFLGYQAGNSDDLGSNDNTFVGYQAGYANIDGRANTAIGHEALRSNTTSNGNTAVGIGALRSNQTTGGNTAIGSQALYYNVGLCNVGLGSSALFFNTNGSYNVALGYYSLYENTSARQNIAIGTRALYEQSYNNGGTSWDSDNIAIGHEALYNNQPTSTSNGIRNIAIGILASRSNTTGTNNVAIGQQVLRYNETGSNNIGLGIYALANSSFNGSNNISIGHSSGSNITTGSNNILLGYDIDAPVATNSSQLSIGNLIFATGGFGTGTAIGSGNVGIKKNNPVYDLDVNGTVQMTGFRMPTGASNGYVLTSNASGVGTWQAVGAGADGDWSEETSPAAYLEAKAGGIATNGAILYGTGANTHINLGFNGSVTGRSGFDYTHCTIGGGYNNEAWGSRAVISGGNQNVVNANYAGISSGDRNEVYGWTGYIGGGGQNTVGIDDGDESEGFMSSVLGGFRNTVSGNYSAIIGGDNNTVSGNYSSAFGYGVSVSSNYKSQFYSSADPGTLIVMGNVGIGNTTPAEAMEITGKLMFSDGATREIYVEGTPGDGQDLFIFAGRSSGGGIGGDLILQGGTSGGTDGNVLIADRGLVGIGTVTPSAKLEVDKGDALIYGVTVGRGAGANSTNTVVGRDALSLNTTGSLNTAIGYRSQQLNLSTQDNTSLGGHALMNNRADFNTAVGAYSLSANSSGTRNSALGHSALTGNETADDNTAVGYYALANNITGIDNTAVGSKSLELNLNNRNTAVGSNTLNQNTVGSDNTAVGYYALARNQVGVMNSAFGSQTLENLNPPSSAPQGFYNSAFGHKALQSLSTGYGNTAMGYFAGQAGTALTTGYYNTGIGYQASFDANNRINTIVLAGNGNLSLGGNNRVRVGNSAMTSIGGQVVWTALSDERIKTNVEENVPGLAFITKLRPVTYSFDIDKQDELMWGVKNESDWEGKYDIESIRFSGFIAQEVEKAAKSIGYSFSGIDKPDGDGLYGIRYAEFVVPLVKAVQELTAENAELRSEIERLKALEARIEALENK